MLREIITIDPQKCNGCGACVAACHEGAIGLVDGKARLMREDYCDGLGDCLPACPTGAIRFETRVAQAYDPAAAKQSMPGQDAASGSQPGLPIAAAQTAQADGRPSRLAQWPCQLKLVPVNAPYFDGANLLIAADCTAFACGDFHRAFMRGHITLIGCPKLDDGDYAQKLTAILAGNNIRAVTVARMQVPCCGKLEHALRRAVQASGKPLPVRVVTIATDGRVLD